MVTWHSPITLWFTCDKNQFCNFCIFQASSGHCDLFKLTDLITGGRSSSLKFRLQINSVYTSELLSMHEVQFAKQGHLWNWVRFGLRYVTIIWVCCCVCLLQLFGCCLSCLEISDGCREIWNFYRCKEIFWEKNWAKNCVCEEKWQTWGMRLTCNTITHIVQSSCPSQQLCCFPQCVWQQKKQMNGMKREQIVLAMYWAVQYLQLK